MKKRGTIIYPELIEVVDQLSDTQAGKLFRAILDYSNDKEPQLDPMLKLVFTPIRQKIDENFERYEQVSKINTQNVNKRWNKEKSEPKDDTTVNDGIRSNTIVTTKLNLTKLNRDTHETSKIIENIWTHYLVKSGSKERLLTGRKNLIASRLKSFSAEHITEAISRCFADPFYSGQSKSGWKANADYIFKNDSNLDKLLNLPNGGNKPAFESENLEQYKNLVINKQ